jgi:hypothetical protein
MIYHDAPQDGKRSYQLIVCRECALTQAKFGLVMTVYRGAVSWKGVGRRRAAGMKLMTSATPAMRFAALHVVLLTPVKLLADASLLLEATNLSSVQKMDPHSDQVLFEVRPCHWTVQDL